MSAVTLLRCVPVTTGDPDRPEDEPFISRPVGLLLVGAGVGISSMVGFSIASDCRKAEAEWQRSRGGVLE